MTLFVVVLVVGILMVVLPPLLFGAAEGDLDAQPLRADLDRLGRGGRGRDRRARVLGRQAPRLATGQGARAAGVRRVRSIGGGGAWPRST